MNAAHAPVLIVGGGIGGLATAIALAQHGIATRVLERRAQFSEAGAGIQLGPNATRVLRRLGVERLLMAQAARPAGIAVHDGRSGAVLSRLPLGDWIESRHGAPYLVAHRRDVQAALLARAAELPTIMLANGFTVDRIEVTDGIVRVHSDIGETAEGAALVGADGQFSAVRRHWLQAPEPVFSGRTAARTVLETSAIADLLDTTTVGVWLAPQAHVVHYPVRAGRQVAVVAILEEDWREDDWSAPADRARLMARLARFPPRLMRALEQGTDWRRWALVDAAPLPAWSRGPVALLGDAAHPVLPFLAQGGAMALEDAVTLADSLSRTPNDPATALRLYEGARRARAARVMSASRRNGRIYHMSGMTALARNAVLRTLPGTRVMAGFDWLYGWTGEA